jgi:uncharacterized membrane protein
MDPTDFLEHLDDKSVSAAIADAEALTSGEIRVFVSETKVADPMAEAARQFHKLRMDKTRERNGILLLFAPVSRTFAVYGDVGICQKVSQQLWNDIRDGIADAFRDGKYTEGVVHAVAFAGRALAQHFPARKDDSNELSDKVVRG